MLRMPGPGAENGREPSPYVELERAAWAALSQATESPLSPEEISRLRGLGDELGERRAREQVRDARRSAAILRAGPTGVARLMAS